MDFLSERVNDAGVFQRVKVDHGDKDQWLGSCAVDCVLQIAVNLHRDGLAAVCAAGEQRTDYFFLPELPLHEGRRDRVDPSGRVNLFPGVDGDAVRGRLDRHRVGPGHLAALVAEEEGHMLFQLGDDLLGAQ